MRNVTRDRAGVVLVLLGLTILLSEWIRASWFNHHPETFALALGIVLGFIGFYIIDPVHAEQGARIVIDGATSVIQVVRSGRRSTDNVIVAKTTTTLPADFQPEQSSVTIRANTTQLEEPPK